MYTPISAYLVARFQSPLTLRPHAYKGFPYIFIYTQISTYLVARCKHFHHVIGFTFMAEPPKKHTLSESIGTQAPCL